MRRLLPLALLCALCLFGFAAGAAARTVSLDGIVYEIKQEYNGEYAEFIGFEAGAQSAAIHQVVEGCPVWYYLREDGYANTAVKTLTIGAEVRDLNQVTGLPSLLYAMQGLQTIRLNAGLTSVGDSLTYGSGYVNAFAVEEGNPSYKAVDGVLFTKDGALVVYPGGREGAYDIPAGTLSVNRGAFASAKHLTRLTVPESITWLDGGALWGTETMTELVLPASMTNMGEGSMPYQGALQKVEITQGNQWYQSVDGVVYSRDGKTLVYFPSGRGGTYDIPEGVTAISVYAFQGNGSLEGLTLPEGITVLPTGTFSAMRALKTLTLPASLQSIEDWSMPIGEAFQTVTVREGNSQYQSIDGVLFSRDGKTLLYYPSGRQGDYTVPEGTLFLAGGAFASAFGLQSIALPEGITSLPDYFFSSATHLEKVYLPASLVKLGESALPAYGTLRRVEVAAGNPVYKDIDGVLFQGTALILYPPAHGSSYDVPPGTTAIGNYAFEGRDMLQTVTIPRSVTELSEGMFSSCTSLLRVSLPITLQKIGKRAFANCIALSGITLPPGLTEVGDWAFYNCPSLGGVTVPNGVTKLGINVFLRHGSAFVLYAGEKSAGYWHAWEYELPWAEQAGAAAAVPNPARRATQSAVVNNASNSALLNLYASPSSKGKALGKYANGTTVQVLNTSDGWARVQVNGQEGYMALDSVVYTDNLTSLVRVTWGRKRQEINSSLKLYEAPYEKAASQRIAQDVSMRILDAQGVWYRVLLNGQEGYVQVKDLNVVYSREPEYDEVGAVHYYVVANPDSHDRLNLREAPSTKSRSLGKYCSGIQVRDLDYGEVKDGWVHVSVDGQEGYMMAEYLISIDFGGESSLWGQG